MKTFVCDIVFCGILSVFLLGSALPLTAQTIPVARLGSPVVASEYTYSSVPEVRELRDGQVLVVDVRDRSVQRLRIGHGSPTAVSRQGDGPNEYRRPSGLFASAGDSTLMWDPLHRQLLVIDPRGRVASALALPAGLWEGTPKGADEQGRVYFEASTFAQGVVRDTVPVVRWTPATGARESVLRVDGQEMVVQSFVTDPAGVRHPGTAVFPNLLGPADEWLVRPGSGLVVARWQPFVIERWTPDGVLQRRGDPIPYERRRLTADDTRGMGEPGGGWPSFKPPFRRGQMWLDADGRVWLELSAAANAEERTYLVVDQDGRPRFLLPLPRTSRVVAAGSRGLYVAERNADDLYRIVVYPMPTVDQ